jgi:hypothetical protein
MATPRSTAGAAGNSTTSADANRDLDLAMRKGIGALFEGAKTRQRPAVRRLQLRELARL